jgi:putative transposase
MPGLASASHAVFQNAHHFEWCTKYRYRIFNSAELINACEASIRRAAARHGIELAELSVMPDHVHCVAEIKPSLSVSHAEGLLKGASAREMFLQFPELKARYWGGHLWGAGRFSRSVGDVGIDVVRRYVRYENDTRQRKLSAY